jgi:hypothetical protein
MAAGTAQANAPPTDPNPTPKPTSPLVGEVIVTSGAASGSPPSGVAEGDGWPPPTGSGEVGGELAGVADGALLGDDVAAGGSLALGCGVADGTGLGEGDSASGATDTVTVAVDERLPSETV